MKLLLCLFLYAGLVYSAEGTKVLLLDSSFPPIKSKDFNFSPTRCAILTEGNQVIPEEGECYDEAGWKKIGESAGEQVLKGLMDKLASVESKEAAAYGIYLQVNPDKAKEIRGNYILSTHGTRSAYILNKYAEGKVQILPLRVVSAQAGNLKQAKAKKESNEIPVYGKGCDLRKWSPAEEKKFNKNAIQPYQERIQKTLTANQDIRVVSISLGYKKSWIAEDNSACSEKFVELEYKILKKTWQNLLRNNKKTLFVVAAGNEGEDFDQEKFKHNDLWADLSDEPNLLLVGSLKVNKERLESSNYGSNTVMVKGEQLEAMSPLPTISSEGYMTTLRGTSFSAPIISGLAVKMFNANPGIELSELKKKIVEEAKLIN